MYKKLAVKFNNGNFTKGSAILKIKYYNPKNLFAQHLPIEEREKKLKSIV